ncbi:MAG: hypothetical protein ACYCVE_08465, partial [Gemmatimonadaceae bacterium]
NGNINFPDLSYVSLAVSATLTSGQRYTPVVGGDVNGDGLQNDRAFIFDPKTTVDTSLARQMSEVLATATRSTRACLTSQLGRIAATNSCETGWLLQPEINLNLNLPWQSFGMGEFDDHIQLSIGTQNAVGALLRLAGLESTSLGQLAGASYMIDPRLLYVSGFDPATHEFLYRVNQQFGEGHPQQLKDSRFTGPFQVTLGGDMHFGGPPVVPGVVQLGLVSRDPKAPPPSVAQVRTRLERLVASPIDVMLRLRITLLLSDAQIVKLARLDASLQTRTDSVLTPIAEFVVQHGRATKDHDLSKRIIAARHAIAPELAHALLKATADLKPEQEKRLPPYLRCMIAQRLHAKK